MVPRTERAPFPSKTTTPFAIPSYISSNRPATFALKPKLAKAGTTAASGAASTSTGLPRTFEESLRGDEADVLGRHHRYDQVRREERRQLAVRRGAEHASPVLEEVGGTDEGRLRGGLCQTLLGKRDRADDARALGVLRARRGEEHDVRDLAPLHGPGDRLDGGALLRDEILRSHVGRREEVRAGRALERLGERLLVCHGGHGDLRSTGEPRLSLLRVTHDDADLLALRDERVGDD
jgi:hypothetical protein